MPRIAVPFLFLVCSASCHTPTSAAGAPQNGAAQATLVVSQSGRGPERMEGGVSYFLVLSSAGIRVDEKRLGGDWVVGTRPLPAPAQLGDSLTFSLPSGNYELRSFVRGCDGNCGNLGPPEDECRSSFALKAGETLHASRSQSGRSCELVFSSTPLIQAGAVAGRVRLLDGTPAAGVWVEAGGSRARTDSDGFYRIEHIPPGSYRIGAAMDPVEFPTYFPGVKSPAAAQMVTVVAGTTIAGMDFTQARPAGVRMRGRVMGIPIGAPAGLIRIILLRAVSEPLRFPVGADGTFELLNVPPGTYQVRALPEPFSCSVPFRTIEVGNNDTSEIVIEGPPMVLGRVVAEGGGSLPLNMFSIEPSDPPGPRAAVSFRALGGGPACPARPFAHSLPPVRPDGLFVVSMHPGEYRIQPQQLPLGYSLKSMSAGSVNLLTDGFAVTGGNLPDIQITLTPPTSGVTVSGRVTGVPADKLSSGLLVAIDRNVGGGRGGRGAAAPQPTADNANVSVLPNGSFEFHNVPPGAYSLTVHQHQVISTDPIYKVPVEVGFRSLNVADRDLTGLDVPVSSLR